MKFSTSFTTAMMVWIGLGMGVLGSPMPKNPPPPSSPIASSAPSTLLLETNTPQTPSSPPSPTPTTNPHNPPNPQFILLPPKPTSASPAAAILNPRSPQATCAPNAGTGNTGCNNAGVGNSGTSNSGINNCGTGNSGVGVGCESAAVKTSVYVATSATTVYMVSTVTVSGGVGGGGGGGGGTGAIVVTTVQSVIQVGATATQTIIMDLRGQRYGCAYWKAQGFTCSRGGRSAGVGGWGWGVVGGVLAGGLLL
ncbi:hypothetical protein L873DRAFT_1827303 [Choiromyces venosus 120613-1]|uniref:Uncharacterized protein n=1 Tax=Choiromyces venosus 120613-1 TaxID=1336337 RepID=A0A3N4K5L6_9PEZI|nr:hypothetical protein L873DRAFT_1827303 [Choiromyces venosus 120613-1]